MSPTGSLTSAVDRDVDRDAQVDAEPRQVQPGLERADQRLLGQRQQAGVVGARHEAARRQDAVLRMADAREGFGAGKLLPAQIDLRLVPELDPVVLERFGQLILTPPTAAAWPSLSSDMIFWMAEVSNGFLSTGSMRSLCCSPACLTVSSTAEPRLLISCTAPVKPDLPSASIDCDGVLHLEIDVEEDQVRRPRERALRGTRRRRRIRSCRRRCLAGSARRTAGCCFLRR